MAPHCIGLEITVIYFIFFTIKGHTIEKIYMSGAGL